MKTLILLTAASLALAGCGNSLPRCATPDAKGVVAAGDPTAQLRSMLSQVVDRSQTIRVARNRDGAAADEAIAAAVEKAVERHGATWERNQITAWDTLSEAELEQVCAATANGDEATIMRFTVRVAGKAQELNEPLLNEAATEVLAEVW